MCNGGKKPLGWIIWPTMGGGVLCSQAPVASSGPEYVDGCDLYNVIDYTTHIVSNPIVEPVVQVKS